MIARWWQIDGSIEAEAKRQKSLTGRLDLQSTADDFKAEISSMKTLAADLTQIQKEFPGKGQAEKAALAMGFPVLAAMLADDDGDGIPNYKDKIDNRQAQLAPVDSVFVRKQAETPEPPAFPTNGRQNQ
jgi:hypothetical protein